LGSKLDSNTIQIFLLVNSFQLVRIISPLMNHKIVWPDKFKHVENLLKNVCRRTIPNKKILSLVTNHKLGLWEWLLFFLKKLIITNLIYTALHYIGLYLWEITDLIYSLIHLSMLDKQPMWDLFPLLLDKKHMLSIYFYVIYHLTEKLFFSLEKMKV